MLLLFFSILFFIKALLEIIIRDDRFMRFYFIELDDNYEYDFRKFRRLDITQCFIVSLVLLLFYLTRKLWILILGLILVITFMIVIRNTVRKKKEL